DDDAKQGNYRSFVAGTEHKLRDVATKLVAPHKAAEPRRELSEKERELEALQKSIDMENAVAKERARAQSQSHAAKDEDFSPRSTEQERKQAEEEEKEKRKLLPSAAPRQNIHVHRRRMRRLQAVK